MTIVFKYIEHEIYVGRSKSFRSNSLRDVETGFGFGHQATQYLLLLYIQSYRFILSSVVLVLNFYLEIDESRLLKYQNVQNEILCCQILDQRRTK